MLKAPFPWFGGKSRAASLIWSRLGNPKYYVEPFAGSLAVLLARAPGPSDNGQRVEIANDLDCYLVNFWRAVKNAPFEVAEWASWPVTEADQNARHQWLVDQTGFRERMNTDPHYFDSKIAGWWVYGMSTWIGDGWCASAGSVPKTKLPKLQSNGVNRQLPKLGGGQGVQKLEPLDVWFQDLQTRLRHVKITCGSWKRVLSPCALGSGKGTAGILLDPPYATARNQKYSFETTNVAHEVRAWAIEHGADPRLRIALCGYEGEHDMPNGWSRVMWRAPKGYQRDPNAGDRERIWLSPHCLSPNVNRDDLQARAA